MIFIIVVSVTTSSLPNAVWFYCIKLLLSLMKVWQRKRANLFQHLMVMMLNSLFSPVSKFDQQLEQKKKDREQKREEEQKAWKAQMAKK